ncbi:MAG: MgtC/SapB family protein [Clostridia bacterium]|nr:MgtC/SapB family protein [Clostridia bacterium]
MLNGLSALRDINFGSVALRMVLAFLCGTAIGFERSYKNRPAGFRTHILVCIGAATASMTGIYLYLNMGLPTDISRLGAQVVSGLGFIGAGTIIVTRNRTVKGLTTAAGLWASGVIGLALGAGFYEGGLVATALVLVTETIFSVLGGRISRTPEFMLTLHYRHKPALDQVMRYCKDQKVAITNLRVVSNNDLENPDYTAVLSLRPNFRVNRDEMMAHIRNIHGVQDVEET